MGTRTASLLYVRKPTSPLYTIVLRTVAFSYTLNAPRPVLGALEGEVLRIRLQRDLGIRREPVVLCQPGEDRPEEPWWDVARGATAKVDRLEGSPWRRHRYLRDNGIHIAAREVVSAGRHGEIAVGADSRAERYVHIGGCRVGEGVCLGGGHASSSTFRAATKASWGTSTEPTIFMRFFPSFCLWRSFFFRLMSPP